MSGLLQILPLAFVMVAGPQILSSFFFATSESWRTTTGAYLLGSALSISIVVTLSYVLGGGSSGSGPSNDTVYWIVLGLLVFAAIHTFTTRKTAEPPKWMGKLQTATPGFAFRLGFLLLGVFPSDLITSIAVGGYLAAQGEPLSSMLGFLGLTLLLLALPALMVLVLGKRAETVLPKIRTAMNDNAWIVNEVVLALFIVIVAGNLT